MWTLAQVQAEYRRLDRLLGIDTSRVAVSFSRRMTRQYGVCTFVKTGRRRSALQTFCGGRIKSSGTRHGTNMPTPPWLFSPANAMDTTRHGRLSAAESAARRSGLRPAARQRLKTGGALRPCAAYTS